MKKSNFYWKKNISRNHIPKLKILFTLTIIILATATVFEYTKYRSLITEFSSNFEENDFSNANNILLTKETLNPFKSLFLQKDLEKYFESKLETISDEIESGNINEQSGLELIQEISRYDIPINNSEGIINNCSNSYNDGVNFFDSGKYIYAYNVFSNIKYTDENYASAVEYIRKCKDQIISVTVSQSTSLANSKEYGKALSLLDSVSNIVGDDESIVSKIEEIKTYQACAISNDATAQATTAKPTNITMSNINQFSLESTTPYLVQVDLNSQKTNIYKGRKNSWNLTKSFSCSTGTNGEETPKGTYTIKEKGAWFFSNSYKQGGKYWVQFYGNYLFHSLPYNEDKSKIVDFTLGKPASHGCIRLGESDSKWIYDNIPRGSKVIIQ